MNSNMEASSNLNPETLKMLQSVGEAEGLTNLKIEEVSGSAKGDGFSGTITFVKISSNCVNTASDKKTLHLVVKSAFTNPVLREKHPNTNAYRREIYMYDAVIPSLQQLLAEKKLPSFSAFAKCYMVSVENEVLILENLKAKGLRLWDRRVPMDHDHIAIVMENYGRFHALSFGLKHQKPEIYEEITKSMDDVFVKFFARPDYMRLIVNECNKAAATLTSSENATALNLFKNFINRTPQFIIDLPKLVDKYSVILHGDCWTNNMLFEYNDCNNPNIPTNVCFIDLQIARQGPPILDVAFFLYVCGSKHIIDDFQRYLDTYYNSLANYLRRLGSDPENIYPYSIFMQQWSETANFGLIMAVLAIKAMLREENEIGDLSEIAESGGNLADMFANDISKSDVWADRISHIILHFAKNKFL